MTIHYFVLSTDTKPVSVAAGKRLMETDTGDMFICTGSTWIPENGSAVTTEVTVSADGFSTVVRVRASTAYLIVQTKDGGTPFSGTSIRMLGSTFDIDIASLVDDDEWHQLEADVKADDAYEVAPYRWITFHTAGYASGSKVIRVTEVPGR